MPFTQDERVLYARALERVRTGELPGELPKSVWTGNGAGDSCALCGKELRSNDVEYEFQDSLQRTFLFHLRCHAIWELAVTRATDGSSGAL